MIKSDIDLLAEYYQYELSYLRSAGQDFSARFPKIARRLDISHNESSDPHVERMIESFAFLTGKLQKQIDDQFPEIASSLLDVLYKPLMLPTPSCTMVCFDVDAKRSAKSPGLTVPKNTQVHATGHSGETCTFRTSHDLQLWPISIQSADVVHKEHIPAYCSTSTYFLKMGMKYDGIAGSKTPSNLRIYIHADALLRSKIFAAIFATEENVTHQKGNDFDLLSKISPVGLKDKESLLPYPTSVHKGFRLLHEYFSFPDKFYGFDITIPESITLDGEFFLYIPMNHDVSISVSAKNFSLSSVPAVNLFSKLSEPLRLDHKQVEYCLVPDYRRYHSHEIYSIEKMVAIDTKNNDEIEIKEFFSCDHSASDHKIFWKSRRKKSYIKDAQGEDVHVSFIDMDFNPKFPADKIFYAHTLCTNRYTAEQIPVNGLLKIEISVPVKQIYCLDRPTIQKPCIKSGEVLWKLISALSLNSLSFSNDGIYKLKEILNVFADISKSSVAEEVDAIVSITSKIVAQRINDRSWEGFARGSSIEMLFDECLPNLGLPLSMVISRFLASHTAINTFTELSVKNVSENGVLKRWDQNYGNKNYL